MRGGEVKEVIAAKGHPNITARHRTTLEITKEKEMSLRADCIVGVEAEKSISELSPEIKDRLKRAERVEIELELPGYGLKEKIMGFGHEGLLLNHPTDIVVRKSSFICGRTLLIKADRAAVDLDREFVKYLKYPETELLFVLRV
jgi:hypothetical protein